MTVEVLKIVGVALVVFGLLMLWEWKHDAARFWDEDDSI